jgi:hypothetical protein
MGIGAAPASASDNQSVPLVGGFNNGTCFGSTDLSQPLGFITRHVKNDGTALYTVHVRNARPNTVSTITEIPQMRSREFPTWLSAQSAVFG